MCMSMYALVYDQYLHVLQVLDHWGTETTTMSPRSPSPSILLEQHLRPRAARQDAAAAEPLVRAADVPTPEGQPRPRRRGARLFLHDVRPPALRHSLSPPSDDFASEDSPPRPRRSGHDHPREMVRLHASGEASSLASLCAFPGEG
jgi:hypothetical protein